MDYQRIYEAFIANRLSCQPQKPAYFEKHHIVPRSLGGTDDQENIIRLTPEDHFFAHLLLAKIHGGKMWAPVAFMAGGTRKDYKPCISRKSYAWAVRAMANASKGKLAHQFDFTIHQLVHPDGRKWDGHQFDFPSIGISKSLGNMLVKGKVKSAKGWYLHGNENPNQPQNHPMYRPEVHHFCHVDGREYIGTQYGLHTTHGIAKPAASMLARGKVKVWNGWHLKGASLPTNGRSSRWSRHASGGISTGSLPT